MQGIPQGCIAAMMRDEKSYTGCHFNKPDDSPQLIRTFDVSNIVNKNPWSGILSTNMFAVHATYHTTLQESTMQLVFGRDAILNIKNVADWEHIRKLKQLRMNSNKKIENMRRKKFE